MSLIRFDNLPIRASTKTTERPSIRNLHLLPRLQTYPRPNVILHHLLTHTIILHTRSDIRTNRKGCRARASASRPSTAPASRRRNTHPTAPTSAPATPKPSKPNFPSSAPSSNSSRKPTQKTSAQIRLSAPSSPACVPPSASTRSRPLHRPRAGVGPHQYGRSCSADRSTTSTLSWRCAWWRSAARRATRTAA